MQPDKNRKDADGGGPAAMSRLMEAKRKAREGMGEQDKPKQGGL